jgi:hypothetical protein
MADRVGGDWGHRGSVLHFKLAGIRMAIAIYAAGGGRCAPLREAV